MGTVAVIASFMMDHISYVEHLPHPGETVRAREFRITVGGKGFNQSVAARRMGAEVSALGCLGRDLMGDQFLRYLQAENIDTSGLVFTDTASTGVGMPVVDRQGQNAIVIAPGANQHITEAALLAGAHLIEQADVLLLQLEIPLGVGVKAAGIAKSAGTTVVLNPAPVADISQYRGLVDIIVPNENEAAELGGGPTDVTAQAALLADQLEIPVVIVTLGAQGALSWQNGDAHHYPANVVAAVDTTGAGDCFCGTLCAQLADGSGLEDAIRTAMAACELAVTRQGAADAMPTSAEVAGLLSVTAP
ncbi:MAG: ribokinase [Propionibacteriaceae bacterium]|jgi:ribokinase|nr:ribokinase [Propionibacteriaceae bacterium]